MEIDIPKLKGRENRPWDWYGWMMSGLGLALMYHQVACHNWWTLSLVIFIFLEFALRVALGRVYQYVYYDTIIHTSYELKMKGSKKYVNASSEEDLELYMSIKYPNVKYQVVEKIETETFIRTDSFQ